jgi:hypothetical protein
MEAVLEQKTGEFVDRRKAPSPLRPDGPERRQFSNDYSSLSPDVGELAEAVDRYKLQHRRRFITFEELYNVMTSLGYHK